MEEVDNYVAAMTGKLLIRAFRRQVERIGFDAATRQYEKWMGSTRPSRLPRRA